MTWRMRSLSRAFVALPGLAVLICGTAALTQAQGGAGAADSTAAQEDPWGGIRRFESKLSARNQTTFTESDGEGYAKITFDIETMQITWEITYDGLTSPAVGIHLHGPAQPGTNAVAIVDLGINGLDSPITGRQRIPDGYAQYMLLGWTYVLLKTRDYPDGELRDKLDVVPPPGYLEKSEQWGRGEL
jgi:hypothetical protein